MAIGSDNVGLAKTLVWGAGLLLLSSGCGNASDFVPIAGTVTIDGKPLRSGTVIYLPVDPSVGRQASGPIKSDGTFTMTSIKSGDGVKQGDYEIAIRAYGEPPRPPTREEMEQNAGKVNRKKLIPANYFEPETSGLTDRVDSAHRGEKNFALSSK